MLFHRPELIVYLLLWSVNQVQALIPPSKTTTPPGVLPASSASSSSSFPIIVKVCRNKTCQKRSPNLVQSLSNLLGKDCIEESGCLAQCDRGPNIQVSLEEHHGQHQHPSSIRPSNRQDSSSTVRNLPQILHEIHDVTTATIQLESIMTTLGSDMMTVSKLIKAAAKVLERASITSGKYLSSSSLSLSSSSSSSIGCFCYPHTQTLSSPKPETCRWLLWGCWISLSCVAYVPYVVIVVRVCDVSNKTYKTTSTTTKTKKRQQI